MSSTPENQQTPLFIPEDLNMTKHEKAINLISRIVQPVSLGSLVMFAVKTTKDLYTSMAFKDVGEGIIGGNGDPSIIYSATGLAISALSFVSSTATRQINLSAARAIQQQGV